MANTTFTRTSSTSLTGFIGGPNSNAGVTGAPEDTQQGGASCLYSC
jgi:hypothetical protein